MDQRTPLFVNTTQPDEQLYASMFRAIYRQNKLYMIYGVIFFALFAILAFCQLYGNLFMPEEEDNWFVFCFMALGAVVMYLFCFQGHRLRAKQLMSARQDTGRWTTVLRFYDDEVQLETATTVTTIPLELLHTIGSDEKGFYFRYGQNILPMAANGFSQGSAEEFAVWAAEHLTKVGVTVKKEKREKKS